MIEKICKECNRRPPAKGRTICETCKSRIYSKKNRPNLVWHWIKKSAKKRGIPFDLPKEQFIELIIKSGYIEGSGRLKDQLSIDRKNGLEGYTMENIQIISKSENSKKYHTDEEWKF